MQVSRLVANPGQMRTVLDQEMLVGLVQQMFNRGFDNDRPLLVTPTGEDDKHRVVRGHRRWLSFMLSARVRTKHGAKTNREQIAAEIALLAEAVSDEPEYLCKACTGETHDLESLTEHHIDPENPPPEDTRWCEDCEDFVLFDTVHPTIGDDSKLLTLYPTLAAANPTLDIPVIVHLVN